MLNIESEKCRSRICCKVLRKRRKPKEFNPFVIGLYPLFESLIGIFKRLKNKIIVRIRYADFVVECKISIFAVCFIG